MKPKRHIRPVLGLFVTICLLATPLATFAKKGEKNYRKGMEYESTQQWEKAAQEFTLALAANPSDIDYQLHYRRALFNASQVYMQKGRALEEQKDFIGAYNAFRQAYGYDPVNGLAQSEMARMLRLHREKTGEDIDPAKQNGTQNGAQSGGQSGPGVRPVSYNQNGARNGAAQDNAGNETQQLRIINYNGDLKSFIRQLADQLGLNVIFDSQSFRTPRSIEINLKDVTTAQALDWVFLQEGLFFQKLSRRTVLVADQNRRPQYQQLVIRTFYLSNTNPNDARQVITQAIPPQQGRPQTIVIPDLSTNSLTVRDTAENVALIEDILRSLDKDRAEVVMDVNIYEVSNTDLLQFGNQVGPGDAGQVVSLGGASSLATIGGSREVASQLLAAPTALGAALLLPQSQFIALQRKVDTKLLASTQVHAFNGEESQARIGQRVPVQTAQTYPFGNYSTTPGTGGTGGTTPGVFNGGFPVIQYEPTGLTLKFTPQVFPNLDVQVKMVIESKDVLGASLTPTFTERTISGTARIQNNRTMMLASVAQDKESNGRQGIPVLGLIPVLGRLFTAPRKDNSNTDIVIAVTPRVIRAPALTPSDEEMRPSGTLQTPTTGSLEALVRQADKEDQLAAARRLPKDPVVQLPDADVADFIPAPKGMLNIPATTGTGNSSVADAVAKSLPANMPPGAKSSVLDKVAASMGEPTDKFKTTADIKSPATLNQLSDKSAGSSGAAAAPAGTAELQLSPEKSTFKVGEKQKIVLKLNSSLELGTAVFRFKFDPKVLAVKGVSLGSAGGDGEPTLMQSVDPSGVVMVALSSKSGVLKGGSDLIIVVEVEAVGAGETPIVFDREKLHLLGARREAIAPKLVDSRVVVIQ